LKRKGTDKITEKRPENGTSRGGRTTVSPKKGSRSYKLGGYHSTSSGLFLKGKPQEKGGQRT